MIDFSHSFLNRVLRSSLSKLICIGIFAAGVQLSAAQLSSENPPWGESERLEYSIYESIEGPQVGASVFTIEATENNGRDLWKIQLETLLDQPAVTIVQVDQETFLPVYSFYRSEVLGEIEAEYKDEGVSIERRLLRNPKELHQNESTYDLYQTCYLMRLFPIEEGYQKKVFITNSKRPIEQAPGTLQVAEIKYLNTRNGQRVLCYRVDAKFDDIRSSFWISADEKRWLYRIVDDSGVMLELDPPGVKKPGWFESTSYDYGFSLPADWLAFVMEKDRGPGRETVSIMTPGLDADITLTRHRKFGDLSTIVAGSQQWLEKNRADFSVVEGSRDTFSTTEAAGEWFVGTFREDDTQKYLYNAVIISGENLFILTGITAEKDVDAKIANMEALVKSIRELQD